MRTITLLGPSGCQRRIVDRPLDRSKGVHSSGGPIPRCPTRSALQFELLGRSRAAIKIKREQLFACKQLVTQYRFHSERCYRIGSQDRQSLGLTGSTRWFGGPPLLQLLRRLDKYLSLAFRVLRGRPWLAIGLLARKQLEWRNGQRSHFCCG